MAVDTTTAALQNVELFRHLDKKELGAVAAMAEEVRVARGELLCEQGRIAQECWVISEGEADVEVGDGRLVGVVGPGESVGEMGLLDHLPRSATVRARTDIVAYRIDGRRFDDLIGASPLARSLLELLSRRIRSLEHGRQLVS